MEQGYLIDSNIVIGYLNNKLPADGMKIMHSIIDDIPQISVITKIEILRFNTIPESYKVLHDFVSESKILDLNEIVVDNTISICKSRRIKLPDAIIAATALVNDFTLITQNISDFKGISGLKLLNPWDLPAIAAQ
ncbi:type II toxin-antitoxin system VapC family toxin [Mucilaginibacter sp.]|uniref:type II toxin-antitoxin system VapC family toxin n=1 Tax=Mucilaginibacter sp. TaxID=1882438 RepID=UPI00284B2F7C|nr:type II toxin-antitoxin system VapC family toxin [Mucilaginibacter sp.]MDR3695072.1 type II toxin-antitoxin system VapC family toxin [Mucilaginibacter sp.]